MLDRDTMDSVKQSAALCLLRLNRTSPDLIPMGEWTSRVVHLLNDQHLVCFYGLYSHFHITSIFCKRVTLCPIHVLDTEFMFNNYLLKINSALTHKNFWI